jgi:glycosyltransferase involved in cell wall biosynthesis
MSRHRILVLINGLGRGGAEQIVASSFGAIDRGRFEYGVAYLLPWKDALVKEIEESGVRTYALDSGRRLGWIGRYRDLVTRERFDLVHAHSPVAAAGARLAFGRSRPPFVYTEHNEWGRYRRATRWANALTCRRNDRIFAVSEEVARSIHPPAWLPGRAPPVETLHHGIDLSMVGRWPDRSGVREELGIPDDVDVVGTVANFKTHKRLDLWFRMAALIRARRPTTRFVVVGQGPLEATVTAMARSTDLGSSVILTGFREDAPRVASAFDVFAMTSDHEGLPIAVVEAMALGVPIVATRVGGLPDLVRDGTDGFLVPRGNVEAAAGRVGDLLGDPALRRTMGDRARERAAAFDIGNAVRRYESVYTELLS